MTLKNILYTVGILILVFLLLSLFGYTNLFSTSYHAGQQQVKGEEKVKNEEEVAPIIPPLDKALYDQKLQEMANNDPAKTGPFLWPVKTVYPKDGAILPFKRIVAYYGNFYSTKMGVLGEYQPEVMLEKLRKEVKAWEASDPGTPVVPAIHYIAVTAQASPGKDGKYRLRMPSSQIDHALVLADKVDGIVFLDIQVGLSNVQTEIPLLEKYLKMPNVHLGLDPEFAMKNGKKPGSVIGTMSAEDINFATNYLAKLVNENDLPPKVLVIHRFTHNMLTGYKQIKTIPEVQIVVDMDGWGFPTKKIGTYTRVVAPEPVQFTGFKLFYKNDLKAPSTRLLTHEELLSLTPRPLYIQYQ